MSDTLPDTDNEPDDEPDDTESKIMKTQHDNWPSNYKYCMNKEYYEPLAEDRKSVV